MNQLLKDQVAIVTGGSRGIGQSIVEEFVAMGANVAFTYRSSEEQALAIENKLSKEGVSVKAYRSDAASYAAGEELVAEVLKTFGKIDILVNNAGIAKDNLMLRMTEEQWNDVIQINLGSVFNLTKLVLRPMLKARKGSIINLSSIVGVRGNAGQANYAAAKAGIIGFSKSVAQELGSRNIRCNVIAPGFIETDMTKELGEDTKKKFLEEVPMRRFGQSAEVAKVASFLASEMSSYVSGQVISVCGALSR